jgi:hypothetical protein
MKNSNLKNKISGELDELLKDVNQIPVLEMPMSIESNYAKVIPERLPRKAEFDLKSDDANHIQLGLVEKRTLLSVSGKKPTSQLINKTTSERMTANKKFKRARNFDR